MKQFDIQNCINCLFFKKGLNQLNVISKNFKVNEFKVVIF